MIQLLLRLLRYLTNLLLRPLITLLNLPFPHLQLFQFSTLKNLPPPLLHLLSRTSSALWTHHLPLLQPHPPAFHAAQLLSQVLANTLPSPTGWTVLSLLSGAGGPVPAIERAVNGAGSSSSSRPNVVFRLSDPRPDIDAWMPLAAHSAGVGFVPQPLDVRRGVGEGVRSKARGGRGEGRMVYLFAGGVGRFRDVELREVLRTALGAADVLVVLEERDRTVGRVGMAVLEGLVVWAVSWWWFWGEWGRLLLTYGLPVLPVLHTWDAVVGCLRGRTFWEMRGLVDEVLEEERRVWEKKVVVNGYGEHERVEQGLGEWTISHARVKHTWPCGWMHATIGIRKEIRRGMD